MIHQLLKYSLALILALATLQSSAQSEVAHIFGQLKDQTTKKKLEGCLVQVFKDGGAFDNFDAGTTGKYDLQLPLGFTYDIKFSKGDYLSKTIRIDTRNIPEEDMAGGFDMNVDGTLFPFREGFNIDLLKEPMAKAYYNPEGDGLEFDFPYSEKKSKEIEAEFKRLDDLEKNFAKLKEDFDKLVQEGDQKMIEKKFGDAVGKYKGALAIFPKDEPVKAKLADAQAKLDAENANKDLEAKYKKFIDDGDKAFKDKKFDNAKKNFQDAIKLKASETYPKEMLYQIDLAMADSERRAEYDAVVADADKKFQNKDYAVSIERYKVASTMYPTESYPKDQMLKAEAALKDLLADEAEKLRLQKEYDDKIALAERSFSEDKLEQAITHYKTASGLKPSEQMPKDKISEIEALIVQRKNQKEQDDANALANSEKERIEKQFKDLVDAADQLFIKEQLAEAKAKYEESLTVKPEAQYPKAKIETIDMMIAQSAELKAADSAKAIQDSLDLINQAALAEAAQRLLEQEEQERLDAERRQQEIDAQRLAAEAKLKAKKRGWDSNADKEAEDQVEKYYQDAAEKEYASRVEAIGQKKRDASDFYTRETEQAKAGLGSKLERIKNEQENQTELASIGSSIQNAAIADNERKKKDTGKEKEEYQKRSDARLIETESNIEKDKEKLAAIPESDRMRTIQITRNSDLKEKVEKNNADYQRKGATQVAENKMKSDRLKEAESKKAFDGEEVRKENETKVENRVKEEQIRDTDTRKSADQRITNSNLSINQKKEQTEELGVGKEINTHKKASELEMQKKELEIEEKKRESRSANDRYDARKKSFSKTMGEPKSEEEYLPVPGTESLKEGVTENSFKLGNKMVTERVVKIGNKVDKYKKVVSKTAIYYFRNGQSITQDTWRQATLSEPE